MRRRSWACVWLLVWSLAAPGRAWAEPHAPELLRQRVVEELLREGVSLQKLGRRLALRADGAAVQVALIDAVSGRIVSEERVDSLPADTDAAIAHLTVVVSRMLEQDELAAPTPAPDELGDPGGQRGQDDAPTAASATAARQREQRVRAWRAYERDFIGLTGPPQHALTAYRGQRARQPMDLDANFYRAVGRADLARAYERRLLWGDIQFGVGVGSVAIGLGIGVWGLSHSDSASKLGLVSVLMVGGGGLVMATSPLWWPSVDPAQARRLAEQHNRQLRQQLGIETPSASRAPTPTHTPGASRTSLRWMPVVSADGAGVLVMGRF